MGITEDDDTKKCVRLNVLHMNGTENMSTVDVYKYFEHYAPTSIEWINGFSCKNFQILIIIVRTIHYFLLSLR